MSENAEVPSELPSNLRCVLPQCLGVWPLLGQAVAAPAIASAAYSTLVQCHSYYLYTVSENYLYSFLVSELHGHVWSIVAVWGISSNGEGLSCSDEWQLCCVNGCS